MKAVWTMWIVAVLCAAPAAAATRAPLGELTTPPGITLEPLGISQGYETGKQTATFLPRDRIAFADPAGKTLYTFAADPVGKSTCAGACAEMWNAAAVPAGAKPFGRWSVVKRADGTAQWAVDGKALYTSARDVDPGSVYGNSPARFGPPRKDAAGRMTGGQGRDRETIVDVPLPDGWAVALAYPVADIPLPADFAVKEVADALGFVLVNHKAMTLYTYGGDAKKPKKDVRAKGVWTPAEAPQLSDPVGDFGFVVRADGIKQWTYKGRGLYTFADDLAPGDANGIGVDRDWQPAALYRNYLPPDVTVQTTLARGKVLATGKGLTLYRREAHIDQTGGGHNLRRGQPLRPAVGREIGIKNVRCDAGCRQAWHPFTAPSHAVAWGQWTVVTHDDGVRQWVYQGYPLWTYDGDSNPGDMTGNDESIYAFAGMPHTRADISRDALVDIGTPQDGGAGLYWQIAVP